MTLMSLGSHKIATQEESDLFSRSAITMPLAHHRAIFLGILETFLKFQHPRISLSTDPVSATMWENSIWRRKI